MKAHSLLVRGLCCLLPALSLTAVQAEEIVLKSAADRVRVEIDGKLFTEYLFEGWHKPVLYPVIGPHGNNLVRNYPFKKDVPGEAADHPHHDRHVEHDVGEQDGEKRPIDPVDHHPERRAELRRRAQQLPVPVQLPQRFHGPGK